MNATQTVKDISMTGTNQLLNSKLQLVDNADWKTMEVNGEDVKIPQEWDVSFLKDLAELQKGKNLTRKDAAPGDIPVVAGGKSPSGYHNVANREKNIITVSASGANAGYVAFYAQPIFATDCTTILANKNVVQRFVFLYLKYKQNEITMLQQGAAQPHVYASDLNLLSILTPSFKEQTLIAQTLTTQEDHIASLKQQSSIQRKRLDWLTDELLSGRIRVEEDVNGQPTVLKRDEHGNAVDSLPAVKLVSNTDWKTVEVNGEDVEIPQEWDFDELRNHASFKKGKGLSKKDLDGGNNPCVHYGELITTYKNVIATTVSTTSLPVEDMILSKNFDVLIPTSAETPNALAQASSIVKDGVILGGDILIISPNAQLFGPYLARTIRREENQIVKLATGITVHHIYAKNMEQFIFKIPPVSQQTLITQTLTTQEEYIASLDQMIAIEEKRLAWLTDELLSGRILIQEVK